MSICIHFPSSQPVPLRFVSVLSSCLLFGLPSWHFKRFLSKIWCVFVVSHHPGHVSSPSWLLLFKKTIKFIFCAECVVWIGRLEVWCLWTSAMSADVIGIMIMPSIVPLRQIRPGLAPYSSRAWSQISPPFNFIGYLILRHTSNCCRKISFVITEEVNLYRSLSIVFKMSATHPWRSTDSVPECCSAVRKWYLSLACYLVYDLLKTKSSIFYICWFDAVACLSSQGTPSGHFMWPFWAITYDLSIIWPWPLFSPSLYQFSLSLSSSFLCSLALSLGN